MKVKESIYNILKIFLISSLSLNFFESDTFFDPEDLDTDEASIESTSSESESTIHKSSFILKRWNIFSEKNSASHNIVGSLDFTFPTLTDLLFIGFDTIPKEWNNHVDMFLFNKGNSTSFQRGPPSIA